MNDLHRIYCIRDVRAVEDLSIDFLVLFEKGSPKFYYIDDDDLLVDVSVLLHFEQGSQLSDHDLARVLAGDTASVFYLTLTFLVWQ